MTELIRLFLEMVQLIASKKPTYRKTGDGSDGTCDCIGLIIGAIRRMGLEWDGIHGSNWTARKALVQLQKIKSIGDLALGDVVLKAYEQGESKWKLPKRYQKGGSYYNGDLRDYYHAGVVTRVSGGTVEITHMTSPTIQVLTASTMKALGRWGYHGQLKILAKAAGVTIPKTTPAADPVPATVTPATGKTAVVTAPSGKYVKLRQQPSTKCRLYEEIPIGTTVTLEAPGETWARVSYGKRKNWYMMAKYLEVQEG